MIYIDIFFLPPISDLSSTIKDFGHMDTGQCASVFTRACHSDLQSKCWQMMPKKFKPQFRFAKLLSAQHPSLSLLPHVWPLTQTYMHLLSFFAIIARVFVGRCKKAKAKIEKPNSSNSGAVIQKRAFKWYWWSSFPPSWQDHCFHGAPYFFRWNAAELLKGPHSSYFTIISFAKETVIIFLRQSNSTTKSIGVYSIWRAQVVL